MTELLVRILADFWQVLGEMAPYLLFGFLMAGLLSVVMSQRFIERHLGGKGLRPVVKSSLLGVPLPLCSCGVIPVGASLKRHGASKAATTAFLISTPQTGVDSIMVTFSLLGGVFAVFRPVFAFLSGIFGGAMVELFTHDARTPAEKLPPCEETCCRPEGGARRGWVRRVLEYGLLTLPHDIGKALLVGLLAAALITALIPKDFFAPLLGGGIAAMVIMMVAGIPIYVCATASVPVAAALMAKGVSPGAAFAFLMTGPATNAATIAMIWKVMGKRTAIIYLSTMALAALAGGLILDQLLKPHVMAGHHMAAMLPEWFRSGSAVVLLGVLAVGVFRPVRAGGKRAAEGLASAIIQIEGMTCSHCAESVRRALMECPGAASAAVDLKAGRAVVSGRDLQADAMQRAVEALGYKVRGVVTPAEAET